jgi:type IV pilus assembly protein PilC
MPAFVYKARNPAGAIITGVLEADTKQVVVETLRRQRLLVVDVSEKREVFLDKLSVLFARFRRVKLKEIVLFTRQLSTLISAGIPIVKSLDILAQQTVNRRFKAILEGVKGNIEKGASVTEAFAGYPDAFSELYVSMVRAGESAGILDEILERISTYLERIAYIKRRVTGAMFYPATVVAISTCIITFLLVFVVPRFREIFSSFGGQLPIVTRLLLFISDFLKQWIWLIIPGVIIIVLAFLFSLKFERIRFRFDSLLLNLPIFGPLFRKVSIARCSRTLGTLVKSGVPILGSLEIVARTSGNKVIERAILKGREALREGERIAPPLAETGVFPPMVTQMISVGEETGSLDVMLSKIADFYDEEVDAAVDNLSSMLEPLLIIAMGIVLGFIIIALFLPMLTISSQMRHI